MKFNSEYDAWSYWMGLYEFHGQEPSIEKWDTMFYEWVDDQGITWLDKEEAEIISSWNGVFE